MKSTLSILMVTLMAVPASANLIDTRTDTDAGGATVNGSLDANEYGPGNAYSYTGGGGGFGGTVGGGALYMNSDNANLYIGFDPGNNLNDNAVILLDTRAGGFTDAQMNDTADPGRNLSSNLTRDVNDTFPAGVLPDFSVVIGQFGIVVFELNAGNTPGHLAFVAFDGTFNGNNPNLVREIALPLGSVGLASGVASNVDFFVAYGSDTNFMSNESIPGMPLNAGGNPGFDNGGNPVDWPNFDRFITAPEPAALALVGVGGLMMFRRRR